MTSCYRRNTLTASPNTHTGYDLGLIGGALLSIRDELHTGTVAEEFIVGACKVWRSWSCLSCARQPCSSSHCSV